mmetsp:Transcript_77024/g.136413  ORF Transcript_77024/g.136413 Transcript_77024/m.136413 type:complete len:81 (-) Transcript_77024:38-280(-)
MDFCADLGHADTHHAWPCMERMPRMTKRAEGPAAVVLAERLGHVNLLDRSKQHQGISAPFLQPVWKMAAEVTGRGQRRKR